MSIKDYWKARPGEFRGDFTRDTFDSSNQYSRVFMQQGRVSIDADWNEQVSILHHHQRTFAGAVIGPHAASWMLPMSFHVRAVEDEGLLVMPGHYFVNGILCENYGRTQLNFDDLLPCGDEDLKTGFYLTYLDVWEKHLTFIEDDSIREVALGGPDTASRAQVTWKIRIKHFDADDERLARLQEIEASGDTLGDPAYRAFLLAIYEDIKSGTGRMAARTRATKSKDPCSSEGSGDYRGKENQLYRVEICKSGDATRATFMWSRENSSVIFPIVDVNGDSVEVEHLGKDSRLGLKANDWVEVVTGEDDCHCDNKRLFQVEAVDPDTYTVNLHTNIDHIPDSLEGTYLRRWDHEGGTEMGVPMKKAVKNWYELEDGVEINFADRKPLKKKGKSEFEKAREETPIEEKPVEESEIRGRDNYQAGDYWLIPARAVTNDIEWPLDGEEPAAVTPHGTVHYYAPLAVLHRTGSAWEKNHDLRRVITQNWQSAAGLMPGRMNEEPQKKAAKKITRKVTKKRRSKKS